MKDSMARREGNPSTDDDGKAPHRKAADILLKNLDETLKGLNTSLLLATTVVAFLLIPGLEGRFRPEEALSHSEEVRNAGRVTIPVLDLQAELTTAAVFGLVLYWIFCLRAAARATHAKGIVRRLGGLDPQVLEAALQFPSVATASKRVKVLVCLSLALLGAMSWIFMYAPSRGFGDAFSSSWAMIIPPAYLLLVLWKPLESA